MNNTILPCSNGILNISSVISTFGFRLELRRLLGEVEVRLNVGVVSSKYKNKYINIFIIHSDVDKMVLNILYFRIIN